VLKLSEHFRKKEERDNMLTMWNKYIYSNTENEMLNNWNEILTTYPKNHPFIIYLQNTWYPFRTCFVKVFY
jgi:hypothetical protein